MKKDVIVGEHLSGCFYSYISVDNSWTYTFLCLERKWCNLIMISNEQLNTNIWWNIHQLRLSLFYVYSPSLDSVLIVGLSLIYRFLLLYFEMSFMPETELFCVATLHHVLSAYGAHYLAMNGDRNQEWTTPHLPGPQWKSCTEREEHTFRLLSDIKRSRRRRSSSRSECSLPLRRWILRPLVVRQEWSILISLSAENFLHL